MVWATRGSPGDISDISNIRVSFARFFSQPPRLHPSHSLALSEPLPHCQPQHPASAPHNPSLRQASLAAPPPPSSSLRPCRTKCARRAGLI